MEKVYIGPREQKLRELDREAWRDGSAEGKIGGIGAVQIICVDVCDSSKHKASEKHLRRYVDEFTFRLNEGNVKRHTFEWLNDLIAVAGRRRITYKELTV